MCHLLRNQDDNFPLPCLSEYLGVLPCGCYPVNDSNEEEQGSVKGLHQYGISYFIIVV